MSTETPGAARRGAVTRPASVEPASPSAGHPPGQRGARIPFRRSPARQAWSPHPPRWVYGEHRCPPVPARPPSQPASSARPGPITGSFRIPVRMVVGARCAAGAAPA